VIAYFGATKRSHAKLTYTVSRDEFIEHEGYNPRTLANDISMIYLPFELPYNRYIKNVKLPEISSSYSTYAGQKAIASGWGTTSNKDSDLPETLQYQTYDIVNEEVCRKTYGSIVANKNVICTDTPHKSSTCKGDSGGPLVLVSKKELVGIASFVSTKGCESGEPAGFTRVTSYLQWIKSVSDVYY